MKTVTDFNEYEIIDMQDGQKLENWGKYLLSRPDPQIIWQTNESSPLWNRADAVYNRSKSGGGAWDIKNRSLPKSWLINYKDMTFNVKLMGFKHTGLFPEQAYNWNYLREVIKNSNRQDVKVLNLFAYTGAATVAALKENASVVHVDSSRGMVDWAKENVKSSHVEDKNVRFLVDDCLKFVKREIRRGNKYDIILMDPPSFGRGANGEVWDVEKDLFELVKETTQLLSDKPLMFLINSYTTGLSMSVLKNILEITLVKEIGGNVTVDELGIPMKKSTLVLPCGIFARWESK
jgi:23S rRNA (cytosine1962-C5)-methyltransferase